MKPSSTLFLLLTLGCGPTKGSTVLDTGASQDSGITGDQGWCAVQSSINRSCMSCHSASLASGGLDLETDAYSALVGATSAGFPGTTLVVAGDPGGSLTWRKLSGTQGVDEGDVMPTTGSLTTGALDDWHSWIADGASESCDGGTTGTGTGRYHPQDFANADQHGLAAKLQEDTCISCHGADLTGGDVGIGCDSCHEPYSDDWRTDCLFCHGGGDNETGAPPEDIDGTTDTSSLTFQAHTQHVERGEHAAYDCVQCHQTPTDILSSGHLFVGDDSPAVSEVTFAGGLSSKGTYKDNGSCANLYCHGYNGGNNGSVTDDAGPRGCGDCHAGPDDGRSEWDATLSGEHSKHLREGENCDDCHNLTVSASQKINHPDNHVTGEVELDLGSVTQSSSGSCSGNCHGEGHNNEKWD